ncbi:MAG: purF [Dehalococcoidia bacterium]|nr:purF [Dehalococcoidia bacterium]
MSDWPDDKPREACGIFGVYAPGEDVARITFFGLYALQHRGQESAGIASSDGGRIRVTTGMGLVSHVFDEEALGHMAGDMAVGHTRYSTTGSSLLGNAQPFVVKGHLGELTLAHNGNVVNAEYLQQELRGLGCVFQSSTDSEVIAHLIANAPGRDWVEKIQQVIPRLEGAYSLVLMTKDALIGVRDPLGVRPLCLGKLNGGWVLASETCALDHLGADFVREVEPGEVVYIDSKGVESHCNREPENRAFCIFEYIYFARPDSVLNSRLLYRARERMGERLADEHPVDADLVIATPDSAVPASIGYARRSGIPYSEGLIKNRYVGRTFIQPDQRIRDLGVKIKFNPMREVIEGQRLVVVDDSIVRGTTTPWVIAMLKKAGAKEVHMRISSPPIRHPCFFGIDMATRRELIAAHLSVGEIAERIGATSLGYLSLNGLIEAIGSPKAGFCTACLTGEYPIPVQLEMDKLSLAYQADEGWVGGAGHGPRTR